MVRSTDRERGTPMTHPNVTVVDHPLIRHKLTIMREATTATSKFRQLLREISLLLAYEVLRDLECTSIEISTPLAPMQAPKPEGSTRCFVSLQRAGHRLIDGTMELVSSARCGRGWVGRATPISASAAYHSD